MRVLLTRPEPDAARTAATLRVRGHEVLCVPLLRVEALAPEIAAGPYAALLITSANAVRTAAVHPRFHDLARLPAFVVGRASIDTARAAGFTDVTAGGATAAELAGEVARRFTGSGARLLYLCGEERSFDLAGTLGRDGLTVELAEIYRAVALMEFPANLISKLTNRQIDSVLHFSRRTAQIYLAGAERAGLRNVALEPAHYCLSAQVAEPFAQAGARRIHIASQPVESALVDLHNQA